MVLIPEKQQNNINLSSLEWIIGKWQNYTEKDIMEEYWYPILGDAMMGFFRWKKAESIFLYEFMLLQQVGETVVLKIKHFDAKLEGWEEKDKFVEYQAWSSDANKVYLRASDTKHTPWMVYERIGSNLMVTFYDISGEQTDQYEFHS